MSYTNPTNAPIHFSIALGVPAGGVTFQAGGSLTTTPNEWVLNTAAGSNIMPLVIPVGMTISAWTVYVQKQTTAGNTITAFLWDANHTNGVLTQIGATQTNGAASPNFITLGQAGLATVVTAGHSYFIELKGSGSVTGGSDIVFGYSVTPA